MGSFCKDCGSKISNGAKYCEVCGAAISSNNDVEKRVPAKKINKYKEDDGLQQMFFSNKGRLNRLRYLKRTLVLLVMEFLLTLILDESLYDSEIAIAAVSAFLLWPQYCLDNRRLQDMNKDSQLANTKVMIGVFLVSASFFVDYSAIDVHSLKDKTVVYVILACLVNLYISLKLLFKGGSRGSNKYGPDPLEDIH